MLAKIVIITFLVIFIRRRWLKKSINSTKIKKKTGDIVEAEFTVIKDDDHNK